MCVSVPGAHLSPEGHTLLMSGVDVVTVQRDLHLSQEGVTAKAVVVPDSELERAGGDLRTTYGVLERE